MAFRHPRILAASALASVAFAATATLLPAAGMAAQRDWTTAFAQTDAGHRVGNPAAATSLVLFESYTCPHCAVFDAQSQVPLRSNYVNGGKVSVEVRHVIRNPVDLAAALVTECGTPDRFLERHHAMFNAQETWMKAGQAVTPAQQERWDSGTTGARMRAIATDLGFYRLMAPHGLTAPQLDRCLADEAHARAIATTSQEQGKLFSIQATPSFVINGKLLSDVFTWPALQAALDARS